MPFLCSAQAAAAAGPTVRQSVLGHFDFVGDSRVDWHGGFGPLLTVDGQTWQGDAVLRPIDGLDVPVATFTMSGVDVRIAAMARSQSQTVKSSLVQVFVQSDTAGL